FALTVGFERQLAARAADHFPGAPPRDVGVPAHHAEIGAARLDLDAAVPIAQVRVLTAGVRPARGLRVQFPVTGEELLGGSGATVQYEKPQSKAAQQDRSANAEKEDRLARF